MACRSNIAATHPVCCCPSVSSCQCFKKSEFNDLKRELLQLRDDVRKKDTTIRDLCNMSAGVPPPRPPLQSDILARTQTLQIHQDVIDDRTRRMQAELDSKFETINSLRREIDLLRRENVKLQEDLHDTKNRLQESTSSKLEFESVKSRHDVAYQVLQEQYSHAQEKIQQLEENVLNHLRNRDKTEQEKFTIEQGYNSLLIKLSAMVGHGDTADVEAIISKVEVMSLEHASLKTQVTTLESEKASLEEYLQAAKDGITNVTMCGRDNEDTIRSQIRAQLEVKINLLQSKLESVEALHATACEERDSFKARIDELEAELADQSGETELNGTKYSKLLECLSEMLSNCMNPLPCDPEEGCVKDRIRQLLSDLKIKAVTVDSLQQRLDNLGGVLKQHVNIDQSLTNHSSEELFKLRQRVKELEFEAGSKSILSQGIVGEKERIISRLKRLAYNIGMRGCVETCGLDDLIDLIESHYETMQCDSQMNNCATCCSSVCCCQPVVNKQQCTCQDQNTLSSLRGQLANKEEKLTRLRSRVNQLESDMRASKMHISTELSRRDNMADRENKRLRLTLEAAESEICRLKQELLHSKEAMVGMLDKNMEMEDLNKSMDKLERVRQLQAHKIAGLRTQVHTKEHSESLALDEARKLVDELRQNERKNIDFLNRICRLLMIDQNAINPSAQAQILEKISQMTVSNNQSGGACCYCNSMGTAKSRNELIDADMQPGFGMKLPPQGRPQRNYHCQNGDNSSSYSYTNGLRRSQTAPNKLPRRMRSMSPPAVRLDSRKY